MKKALLFFIFIIGTSAGYTQIPYTNLQDAGLKGPIKQLVERVYHGRKENPEDSTLFDQYITKFDKYGNIIVQYSYDKNNKKTLTQIYDYGKIKQVIVRMFNQDNLLKHTSIFIFDNMSRLIQSSGGSPNSAFVTIFKYDIKGKKISEQSYHSGVLLRTVEISYNNEAKIREVASDSKGKEIYRIVYTYDKSQRIRQMVGSYSNDHFKGNTVGHFFDFDKYNNWTLQKSHDVTNYSTGTDTIVTVTKRTIKYY